MKKAGRILGVILVVVLLFAAIIASFNAKPSIADKVWDAEMTVGNMEAKNYFVIYSDIACPYCLAFENAIVENEEAFQKYIQENDILLEVRLSDFLYHYGESRPKASHDAAVAAYCAKNEGKFWDYYNLVVSRVWNEFFKDAGKAGFVELSKKGKDYWIDMGEEAGLSDTFENCVKEEKTAEEVAVNAERTSKTVAGMPYFKFNSYTSSGFDLNWGFDYVLMYFDAGLESR